MDPLTSNPASVFARELSRSQSRWRPALRQAFRQSLRTSPSAAEPKVLDVGCGAGLDLETFRRQGLSMIGLEIAPPMTDALEKRGEMILRKDVRFYSDAPSTWDGIWCHDFIHQFEIETVQRILGSFFSTLKPRGALGLTFIPKGEEDLSHLFDDPIHRFDLMQISSLLRQSGFWPLKIIEELPSQTSLIAFRI